MGYYEVWRWWFIFDEIRARDLQELSKVLDAPHATTEYRTKLHEELEDRQPRRFQKSKEIPSEVLERLKKAWDGRRQQH